MATEKMNARLACDVLGISRAREGDLSPMVRALSLHSWLNTDGDKRRLAAAKWAIRNWPAYQAECNRRRRDGRLIRKDPTDGYGR